MKQILLPIKCIFSLLFFLCFAFTINAQTHFTAKLTGDQQNPAVTSSATGTGVFQFTTEGLKFSISIDGLEISNAHFHTGAIGENGGVARGILDDFVGNTARGIWTSSDAQPLTDELLKELMAGNIYINIHTTDNPGGEIRGQINLSTGTGFAADFTGDQVNPAIVSSANGTGNFTLTDEGLIFSISVVGLDITNAHFHIGGIGENGGVARGILDDFVGNTALGIWTSTDAEPLTDELIESLLLGNLYVNLHTASNPGGEIRGQVLLSSGLGFSSNLDGTQEVPAVVTDAKGTGSFTLTDAGLIYSISVEGLEIANAHFHIGEVGENGGVARGIFNDFVGNTASGVWRNTDAEPLTREMIAELLRGNIYVNIHTADNAGGEIRGQVLLSSGTTFTANINADQVNVDPPLTSTGSGTGTFILTDAGLAFSVSIDGIDITNAHFHTGAIGENGGVARGILDDFVGNTASGIWTSSDTQPLTDELLHQLLAGELYLNIHTAANPGGEIRGQVNLTSGTNMTVKLNAAQVNVDPPITSTANGTGNFTLTDAGLVFSVSVEGLDITNAHFHFGATGENGGVARDIFDDFNGNTARGIWTSSDTQPLTDSIRKELLVGNIYLNIHTAANPGGEIRGQVLLSEGIGFAANLMGEQEVPPVSTSASGTGAFTLTDAGLIFNTTVNEVTIANAHFHNAPIGENGGVARGIAEEFDGNTVEGVWTTTDAQPLTNDMMAELMLGNIYVNIHSADHPSGEIRGQLSPFGFVTSIENIDPNENLNKNSLLQNFPNPFTDYTEIQFELKQSGQTKLIIYNLLGKEIATLVNEKLTAGAYQVSFESQNLPFGVYIYQLESNGISESKKMILKR